MNPGDTETQNLREEFNTFMEVMMSLPIKLPGTKYWKALKSRSNILKEIGKKMRERLQKNNIKTNETDAEDLLGIAMNNTDLTSDQILDLILSMLFGGHEQTTRTITFAIYFLGKFPRALEELQSEHLEVVRKKKSSGESTLTWEDYKQMDFTHCGMTFLVDGKFCPCLMQFIWIHLAIMILYHSTHGDGRGNRRWSPAKTSCPSEEDLGCALGGNWLSWRWLFSSTTSSFAIHGSWPSSMSRPLSPSLVSPKACPSPSILVCSLDDQ